VVENHKNEIFDEIIKVCETVGAPQPLIEELGSAKQEVSFTKAMKQIKTALDEFGASGDDQTHIQFVRDAEGKIVGAILDPGPNELRGVRID
jgi:hypothetical protein